MTPYDGSGYGHSIYWRTQMKIIAEYNSETCKCWSENEPKMNFVGDKEFEIVISCSDKKDDCKDKFEVTQKELTEKFKNFHKV